MIFLWAALYFFSPPIIPYMLIVLQWQSKRREKKNGPFRLLHLMPTSYRKGSDITESSVFYQKRRKKNYDHNGKLSCIYEYGKAQAQVKKYLEAFQWTKHQAKPNEWNGTKSIAMILNGPWSSGSTRQAMQWPHWWKNIKIYFFSWFDVAQPMGTISNWDF